MIISGELSLSYLYLYFTSFCLVVLLTTSLALFSSIDYLEGSQTTDHIFLD